MTEAVERLFTALADTTRRDLIERIALDGPQTATELAAKLPITRQGVTKHLTILAEAGLLNVYQEGRDKRYALTPEPLEEAISWIHYVGALWDQRLANLRAFLEEDQQSEE